MALDPNHWSSKLQAAFKTAIVIAAEQHHAETRVLHLGLALFEDSEGLGRQVRTRFRKCCTEATNPSSTLSPSCKCLNAIDSSLSVQLIMSISSTAPGSSPRHSQLASSGRAHTKPMQK